MISDLMFKNPHLILLFLHTIAAVVLIFLETTEVFGYCSSGSTEKRVRLQLFLLVSTLDFMFNVDSILLGMLMRAADIH